MRFRRRRDADPESGADPEARADPSVWAPPAGDGAPEAGPSPVLHHPGPPPDEFDFDRYEPEVPDDPDPPEQSPPEPTVAEEATRPVAVVSPRSVVTDPTGAVRAAGGVVWTEWGGGLRVLVVHRPRYDDWSLPKGKAEPGESDTACALREVREETGLACSLGAELPSTSYLDRHGRPKTVRYWAMHPLGGSARPQNEVDEVRWVSPEEAKAVLSYERDAAVVDALVDHLAPSADEPGG